MPTLICVSGLRDDKADMLYSSNDTCSPDDYDGNFSGDDNCSPDDSCWPD